MSGTPNVVAQSGTPSSASLYVGDLASDVTEALLFEIFNAVGPVASIRVCRDAVTRRSLGYAYVNFHNVMDAERALDTMNFINIRGKPCRIMWSQRDPSLRKSGVGNVFVKNLDKTIDHKTLYDTFSMFGNILSCKVATDENGESRGYGFVHYTNPESASKAIQKVNGMVIAEKKVTVAQFIPKEQRQQGVRRFTNVYVCGFPPDWSGEQLQAEFETAGQVNSVHVAISEKGLPFGFANFPNHEEAARAVELFNGKQLDEQHKLYVARAMKKQERAKFLSEKFESMKTEYQKKFAGVNLYVKYLDDSIDDPRLRKEFEKFGTITSAKVMRDANGRSKGFGFVCFEQPEQSTRAMAEMNSKLVEGKPLYVALAQRKEVRKANLEKEDPRTVERRGQKPFGNPNHRGPKFNQGPRGPKGPFNPQGGPKFNNPMYYQQQRGMNPMMFPQAQNMMMQRGYPGMNPQMRGYRQMNMPMQNFGMPPPNQMQRGAGAGRPMMPPQAQPRPPMQQPQHPPSSQPPQQKPMAPATFEQRQQRPDHSQPLTSEMLSAANPSQQKQMIGERIFPRIQSREPKLAGKITGMLLEMDNMELLHLLDDENALMAKINEALAVLNQHQVNNEEPNSLVAGAE